MLLSLSHLMVTSVFELKPSLDRNHHMQMASLMHEERAMYSDSHEHFAIEFGFLQFQLMGEDSK